MEARAHAPGGAAAGGAIGAIQLLRQSESPFSSTGYRDGRACSAARMSHPSTAAGPDPLPDDVAALKALLLAERAQSTKLTNQNEHLRAIIKELQRALFGRRSEKTGHPDQLQLALEDLEQTLAEGEAEAEKTDATLQASRRRSRRVNRGALPKHLPREEVVIEPESTTCPCCQGTMHQIGEDVAERLPLRGVGSPQPHTG